MKTHSSRRLAILAAVVFLVSTGFPVVAGLSHNPASFPKWWGILDVGLVFLLGVLAMIASSALLRQSRQASGRFKLPSLSFSHPWNIVGAYCVLPRWRSNRREPIFKWSRLKNTEDALMHSPQRLLLHKPLQRFPAEAELAQSQRPFRAETSSAKAFEVLRRCVLGSVDDAKVLPPTALHRRLHETASALGNKLEGFTTMPSPPEAVSSSHQVIPSLLLSSSLRSITLYETNPEGPARLTRRLIEVLVCILIFETQYGTLSAAVPPLHPLSTSRKTPEQSRSSPSAERNVPKALAGMTTAKKKNDPKSRALIQNVSLPSCGKVQKHRDVQPTNTSRRGLFWRPLLCPAETNRLPCRGS